MHGYLHFGAGDAEVLVDGEARQDEVLGLLGDLDVRREGRRVAAHQVRQLLLRARLPRHLPEQQLVEHDPQAPDVRLLRVLVLDDRLRRHVQRSTHVVVHLLLRRVHHLREPVVRDLRDPILQEDVRRLQVAVDDP